MVESRIAPLELGVFSYSTVPIAVAPFGASASPSVGVLPVSSMRAPEPFPGQRCAPSVPGPGHPLGTERSDRDPRQQEAVAIECRR